MMSRSSMLKLFGRASRNAGTSTTIPTSTRSFPIRQFTIPPLVRPLRPVSSYVSTSRAFSTSKPSFKGLSPESENPTPKEAESHNPTAGPADISIEKFHDLADEYMNALIEKLEQLQEEDEDVDCEYSVCLYPLPHQSSYPNKHKTSRYIITNLYTLSRPEYSPSPSPPTAHM
jgi:frataxin